jgi:hypothetical protein
MNELEKDVEKKLRQMVEKHGGLCLKWVCPGWSGVPDRIVLLPGGVVMFAETKRPKGGKLEPLQRWWQKQLQGLGFWSVVVWDLADVKTFEMIILDEIGRRKK